MALLVLAAEKVSIALLKSYKHVANGYKIFIFILFLLKVTFWIVSNLERKTKKKRIARAIVTF